MKPPGVLYIAAFLPLLLAGCRPSPPPVTYNHAAYVWQRQWNADLVEALAASRASLTELRVLALERDPGGRWVAAAPDLAALAADGRPVVLVVRIDGFRPPAVAEAAAIAERLTERAAAWRAAGVRLVGLELDHDCARARLPEYVRLLDALKPALPALSLSITALPDWTGAPGWAELLATVDHAVLQVHAVDRPERGIFEAERAEAQARTYAAQAGGRPWRLALPVYGLALRTERDGRVSGIEAERPRGASPAGGWHEWQADPVAVAGLLKRLQAEPPAGLAGILWFRLPRAGDRRAWSWTTLEAVIGGRSLHYVFEVAATPTSAGAYDLTIVNHGTLDAEPPIVRIDGDCAYGDALPPWRRELAGAQRFVAEPGQRLRAGSRQAIGWLRCAGKPSIRPE